MDWKLLITVFSTIFIAEIGDKTQLATLLYASGADASKLTVFLGASLALILGAVGTVTRTLIEAILVASVCVVVVLRHFRASLVVALASATDGAVAPGGNTCCTVTGAPSSTVAGVTFTHFTFTFVATGPFTRIEFANDGANSEGEDSLLDVVTLNDLRVPKDRPILLQIGATDVIHSFYLPNVRQKMDAVPGTITHMWFQVTETGEFDIACAQHCGTNHYLMKGKLTILEPADFDAWAEQATKVSSLDFDPNDAASHWGWEWTER